MTARARYISMAGLALCMATSGARAQDKFETTGKTPLHYVKTMIIGHDAIPLSKAEAAYLAEDKPGLLK